MEIDQVPKYLQESLTCPITAELFQDPVVASDGATYERVAIKQWLSMKNCFGLRNRKSPSTGVDLNRKVLIDNISVRKIIDNISEEQKNLV